MAERIREPDRKCANCGQPMFAWMVVNVVKVYTEPETFGTMRMKPGVGGYEWCLDCVRGKNDPKWLHAKPWR